MSTHTIRLVGAWERAAADAAPVRVRLPFKSPDNAVRLIRRFHRPTGLTEDSIVRITLTVIGQPSNLRLNGKPLLESESDSSPACCFDITRQMQSFNTLEVELTGELKNAALEIVES